MRFGLLYEAQRPFKGTSVDWNTLYKETLEQCVLAENVGFDNLWFVEHHFLTGFSASPCPEVLLGALSQLTKRIRIGFGVSILPAHHPIHVAERAAMLDQLTDGRLEFGTGRSNAYEQLGQGITPFAGRTTARPGSSRPCRSRRSSAPTSRTSATASTRTSSSWSRGAACPTI